MAWNVLSRDTRNTVLALYEPVLELPRHGVREPNVVVKRSEERYTRADQDGDSSNGQFVDEPSVQKPSDGLSSINVKVYCALGCQAFNEALRRQRQPFDAFHEVWRNRTRLATEHDDLLAAIRPGIEGQHEFERVSAQDDGIHGIHEFLVAKVLLG